MISFFALGGDTIMSIQLASRVKTAGVGVTVRDMFERKTVRGLAQVAAAAGPRWPSGRAARWGRGGHAVDADHVLDRRASAAVDRFAQSMLVRLPPESRVTGDEPRPCKR